MDNDDETSLQDGGPEIPAGVLRTSKKGWAGEEIEMEHRKEQQTSSSNYAAVDIKQFQNTKVGTGYQARGVVRQKTAPAGGDDHQRVRDMTAKPREATSAAERKQPQETTKRKSVDEYLQCEGIREFRKEIEQLLSSASR